MDPLSTLMSIAGQNRSVGTGDVVPYQRSSNDSPNASQAEAAKPGPSSPGASFNPTSSLSNLSALTPQYNAAIQALLAGSIPSGTAQAVATPLPAAAPGPSSSAITSQASLGTAPIAGAPGGSLAPDMGGVGAVAPGDTGGGSAAGAAGTGTGDAGGSAAGAAGAAAGDAAGAPAGDAGAAAAAGSAAGVSGDAAGAAAGGVGDGGGTGDGGGGTGDGGGGGGVYKKGGFVNKGKPNSKTDDVSAKLQHGEFVIPRDAVIHLAAHAPDVLSHVMHVSAMHHMANRAKEAAASPSAMLTPKNGVMPPQPQEPQGFRNGGLVMPGAAVPQVHPAAMDLIRRAIAAHTAPAPVGPTMAPPQMARSMSPMPTQGRPPAIPPMERLDATKNATGGSHNAMTRSSAKV
jgi:hypothetical protein